MFLDFLRSYLLKEQGVCFHILEMFFFGACFFFFTSLGSTWVWVLWRFFSLLFIKFIRNSSRSIVLEESSLVSWFSFYSH